MWMYNAISLKLMHEVLCQDKWVWKQSTWQEWQGELHYHIFKCPANCKLIVRLCFEERSHIHINGRETGHLGTKSNTFTWTNYKCKQEGRKYFLTHYGRVLRMSWTHFSVCVWRNKSQMCLLTQGTFKVWSTFVASFLRASPLLSQFFRIFNRCASKYKISRHANSATLSQTWTWGWQRGKKSLRKTSFITVNQTKEMTWKNKKCW